MASKNSNAKYKTFKISIYDFLNSTFKELRKGRAGQHVRQHGTPPFSMRLRTRHIFNLWDRGTLLTSFGEKEGIFVVVTINFNYVCTSFQFFSTF